MKSEKHQTPNAEMEYLIKIDVVAARLGLTVRGVQSLVKRKVIPVIRVSRRMVRFHWPSVVEALERYEVREIGR